MIEKYHEGIHYIFDRYAFLNKIMADGGHEERLSPVSTAADIETVLKHARVMYHPDRQTRTGESMRKQAEQMTDKINQCADFLLDEQRKPFYDEKLAYFDAHKPQLISDDGHVIIDIHAPLFSVETILSDEIVDTTELEAKFKELTQFDDSAFSKAKSFFAKFPEDDDVRSMYRDALTKKWTYLSLIESTAWLKIGHHNHETDFDSPLLYPDKYTEKVEESLQKSKGTDIGSALGERGDLVRIGMMSAPLLLSFNPAATSENQTWRVPNLPADPEKISEILARLKEKAEENFEIRAEYVRDIARQKQEVLTELVELAIVKELTPRDQNDPVFHIYVVDPDGGPVLFRLAMNMETARSHLDEGFEGPVARSEFKIDGMKSNSLLIERNIEIEAPFIEALAVGTRLMNEYQAAQKAKAQPVDTAPAPAQP